MKHSFYIAWCYLRYNWIKTLLLIFSISLILFIPLALNALVKKGSETMLSRAENSGQAQTNYPNSAENKPVQPMDQDLSAKPDDDLPF